MDNLISLRTFALRPAEAGRYMFTDSALLIRRSVAARGSAEHPAAVGEPDDARVAGRRSVLRSRSLDRHFVTRLERISAPSLLHQHGDCAKLEIPMRDLAVGVLRIHIEPCMRVHPLQLDDRA